MYWLLVVYLYSIYIVFSCNCSLRFLGEMLIDLRFKIQEPLNASQTNFVGLGVGFMQIRPKCKRNQSEVLKDSKERKPNQRKPKSQLKLNQSKWNRKSGKPKTVLNIVLCCVFYISTIFILSASLSNVLDVAA